MNPLKGVIGEAWGLYTSHASFLLPIAFVVYLVAAALTAVLALVGSVFGAVLALIISFIAVFLVQAALVGAVRDIRQGRGRSFGTTIEAAAPLIGPIGVVSIIAGFAIAIGFVLFIIPGLILLTFWVAIVPVIVIERSRAMAAFGRSMRLVSGYAWHVFATLVLVVLLMLALDVVLGIILAALPGAARSAVSSIVSGTLVAPFLALIVTLVYYRLVAAHEGTATGPPMRGGPAEPPWPTPPA